MPPCRKDSSKVYTTSTVVRTPPFSELDCMPGIYRLFTVPFSVPQLQLVMPTETTFGASQSASNRAGIQLIQIKPKLFQILLHISLRFGPTINTFKAR